MAFPAGRAHSLARMALGAGPVSAAIANAFV
jgi:hypothetical protein